MKDVTTFLGRILPVLQMLVAGGIIKSSSGIEITNLIGDVQAVINGAQNPSVDLISQVEQLLKDLQADGILQGKFIDELNTDMAQFATFAKAIQSAQAGIGPKETLLGVAGSWVFIPDAMQDKPFGL